MADKQKIADLEKRVKDLEARPQAPTIIVFPANPIPAYPTWPAYPPMVPWWQPWITWGANTGHPDCTYDHPAWRQLRG